MKNLREVNDDILKDWLMFRADENSLKWDWNLFLFPTFIFIILLIFLCIRCIFFKVFILIIYSLYFIFLLF